MAQLTTDVAIRKWRPEKDGAAKSVGGRSGLYIRGWLTGKKAFYFRAPSWLKVGDYPEMSLATAREFALVARRLVKAGFGVDALKTGFANARSASTFERIVLGASNAAGVPNETLTYDDVFKDWYARIAPNLQEGPSRRRPQAIHELHISPVLGRRLIVEIRRREIFDLLAGLFETRPVTAGHALGHLRKVFELAINRELVESNPVPPRTAFARPARKVRAHGTLPPDRMPELWEWLGKSEASEAAKLAILMAMCTAHRISVITHAQWAHVDLQTRVWTVPERDDKSTPGRMKSGRPYSLRLPDGLLTLLTQSRRRDDQQDIFESPVSRGPITPNAILKLLKTFDSDLTAHGFRNAIKVWCRRADPPVPDYVADAFCDHSLKGLDASYRRMDTSAERAEVSARLFDFVLGCGDPTHSQAGAKQIK